MNLPRNLQALQERLRRGYVFAKAYGATPSKGAGKAGKRPIVVAPLEDRIVQRAILDVLQNSTGLPAIARVLATPTSIGGIKGRGVDDAIRLFHRHLGDGHTYVAGSDISGFFRKIKPSEVLAFVSRDVQEQDFLGLLERALTVELANRDLLNDEDVELFPTGDDGVAQGCPLSALAGNIVLEDFDRAMNDPARGVVCIRYIDDFIILGKTQRSVIKAMASAAKRLQSLGMSIYDPATEPAKAFAGPIGEPHIFLGYELVPGRYAPSNASRQKLLNRVDVALRLGRGTVEKTLKGRPLSTSDKAYAQTLVEIDNVVRGWRGSYRVSNCPDDFQSLDRQIEGRLDQFNSWFRHKVTGATASIRRQALGITLLDR